MTTKMMMEQMMAQMAEVTSTVKSLDERLTKLEGGKQTSLKSATKVSTKTSSSKKSNGNFDRSLYEAKAKELGCFNHGVVVATVEDGKVVRSRKQNRDLVYKAMGIR